MFGRHLECNGSSISVGLSFIKLWVLTDQNQWAAANRELKCSLMLSTVLSIRRLIKLVCTVMPEAKATLRATKLLVNSSIWRVINAVNITLSVTFNDQQHSDKNLAYSKPANPKPLHSRRNMVYLTVWVSNFRMVSSMAGILSRSDLISSANEYP